MIFAPVPFRRITPLALALSMTGMLAPAPLAAQTDTTARPLVLVIATGGTIAGVQNAPGTLGGYRAGTLTAEQVVASVPELSRHARVEAEQFSNVASTRITTQQWVALSKRINSVLRERPEIAGVVVTHGTDRLEETAFFLYLTVRSEKPVVVVGAQRPATGISPDGPINLLSAVRTVAAPEAVGMGVMVVMDDRILSAREVRKQYQRVGGFTVGEMGMLGVVSSGGPEFFFAPARRHGERSEFTLDGIDSLPRVELAFSFPGGTGPRYDTLPAGVVVATTGFAPGEGAPYRTLRQQGVVVVTAFPSGDNVSAAPRLGSGANEQSESDSSSNVGVGAAGGAVASANATAAERARRDSVRAEAAARAERAGPPMVVSQHLTPQKARILLMLALTKSRDPREVQRYFLEY
jgi:L-asparaginase type II